MGYRELYLTEPGLDVVSYIQPPSQVIPMYLQAMGCVDRVGGRVWCLPGKQPTEAIGTDPSCQHCCSVKC